MVGDRMDTDVVSGLEAGMHTVLVLTGSTTARGGRGVSRTGRRASSTRSPTWSTSCRLLDLAAGGEDDRSTISAPHQTDSTGSAEGGSTATIPPPSELAFIDLRDRPGDELLTAIHAAGGLYERSFPRDEEREDLETHRDALWGAGRDTPPLLHFIVATPPGRPDEIVGFAAAEYYPASRCGLLSYIAVDRSRRNARVGHSLVQRSVEVLRADAGAAGHQLAAVFGEIHDPARVEPGDDSMAPLDRLRVMDALGARRVPIPYVQPPLSEGGERGRTLMLVAFPVDGHPVASLGSSVVRGFLGELYDVLEVPDLQRDLDFARSLVALQDETLDLMRLVPREHPTFVRRHRRPCCDARLRHRDPSGGQAGC